jgi:alkanesulfonate monooxygenase SsuD/methylene tetrahydromethanopterin reductase-like flavin-dependent oxidoreductase (luciferase family)
MPIEFGASIDPSAAALPEARRIARRADELGFELVGIQDHPYQRRFLDTWMLIATLLAETERVRLFPNVTNLPLRGPAMIAKQAASLDVLSGGRFELGLGAGAFWEGIEAMGGPRRTPGQAVDALEEAIEIIRAFWRGDDPVRVRGRFYSIDGLKPGPRPAHPIELWVGAYKPRMLALTGRRADGWIPSLGYLPPDAVPEARGRVDEAARAAGRDPSEIRRLYNLGGTITDGPVQELLAGPPSHWIEELTRFNVELGFDTFVFWPREDPVAQLERFAQEVAPGVREAVQKS